MKPVYILSFLACSLCFACQQQPATVAVSVQSKAIFDTLRISELVTGKKLATLAGTKEQEVPVEGLKLAKIQLTDEAPYLAILTEGRELNISILPDSSIQTHDVGDSLLNYLWKSNFSFIGANYSSIFQASQVDSVPILFEEFRQKRTMEIDAFEADLTAEVSQLLHYQNSARIYSFLFWFGRVQKELEATHRYFDFIDRIAPASDLAKTLPDIYLYQYETAYLREHPSIKSLKGFLTFIEKKTADEDMQSFLKAYYIKGVIEQPSQWKLDPKLLHTKALKEAMALEAENPYLEMLEKPLVAFYASQSGEEAFVFTAEDDRGNIFKLSSLKGKVVFIDVWATWCGPCLSQKPKVLQLAEKFQGRQDLEILFVSVDDSKEKWLQFLKKEGSAVGRSLFIEKGMQSEFGQQYNIGSIPRYILIGKDGEIINSNLQEPSEEVEQEIERALQEEV